MNLKRLLTTVVGLPLVSIALIFGNKYIIDVAIAVIAMIAIYEYSKCISTEAKFITPIGYVVAILMAFMHVVSENVLNIVITLGVPILLLAVFLAVIVTDMKITFKDATFTLFGVFYIVGFLGFIPILYAVDAHVSGKILIWFIIITSWGSDIFAYLVGKNFGKHKFSKVSPNKTIEGCIGGVLGAVIISIVATYFMNRFIGTEIAYSTIAILSLVLSLIGQIGDFSASVIKRYFNVKDFSELFPGHGGMIDRIDSVMFIAPFAYFLLTMFI